MPHNQVQFLCVFILDVCGFTGLKAIFQVPSISVHNIQTVLPLCMCYTCVLVHWWTPGGSRWGRGQQDRVNVLYRFIQYLYSIFFTSYMYLKTRHPTSRNFTPFYKLRCDIITIQIFRYWSEFYYFTLQLKLNYSALPDQTPPSWINEMLVGPHCILGYADMIRCVPHRLRKGFVPRPRHEEPTQRGGRVAAKVTYAVHERVLPRSSPPELRQVFVVAADERSEQAKPSANCVVWVTRWVEVDGEESQKRALLYPRGTRSPTAETPKRNVTLDSRPCVQRSVSGPRAVWGVTGIGVARKSLGGSRYQ